MTASPTRVLAIGLDAASPELLARWMEDGTLPHLRALAERGTAGRLGGVEGFFVGATWPTLYTGTGPARHGFHYQLQIVPGTYELHRATRAAFVRTEPFWTALDRAGLRVAALDVPLARPDPTFGGMQVVEWGAHDAFFGHHTTPPELAGELRARFGGHPQGPSCDAQRSSAEDYRGFLERLEEGIRRKVAWTGELLGRGGWDLLLQVFTESHCAGHQCWHLHDPAHPAHDAAIAEAIGDPLRRIYAALDAAVGELAEAAGGGRVVVFTGHGMSHWYGAQFLLPEILERLGVTRRLPEPEEPPAGLPRRAAAALWHRLPAALREPVWRRRERRRARREAADSAIPRLAADPGSSLCFPVPNGQAVGGIRLNLAGREPAGRLRPGAEAEAFCERLGRDLCEIVDARTGGTLVRRVLRTADLHQGERRDDLPDLLVEWSDEVPTGSSEVGIGAGARVRASSPKIGVVEGTNDYGRTGEHRPGGWVVVAGPGMPTRSLERTIPLVDLAPSLAAMLGVPMPGAEGRPAPELSEPVSA